MNAKRWSITTKSLHTTLPTNILTNVNGTTKISPYSSGSLLLMSSHVLSSHVLMHNSHRSSQFKEEYLPTISFSAPQSERRVLMSLKCPANRMLSASLVSHSAVRLGSKLSSQVISSSNMAAGLIFSCSISDAARNKKENTEKISSFGNAEYKYKEFQTVW